MVRERLSSGSPANVYGISPRHPTLKGQLERMNCTVKEAAVRNYQHDSQQQLRVYLVDFVVAYNSARRPRTLRGLTADEAICKARAADPSRFNDHPRRQMTGSCIARSY